MVTFQRMEKVGLLGIVAMAGVGGRWCVYACCCTVAAVNLPTPGAPMLTYPPPSPPAAAASPVSLRWQLFEPGTPCRFVYLVVKGMIALTLKGKDVSVFDAGGLCGGGAATHGRLRCPPPSHFPCHLTHTTASTHPPCRPLASSSARRRHLWPGRRPVHLHARHGRHCTGGGARAGNHAPGAAHGD